MKKYHFLICGEDERQYYLKQILQEKGYAVEDEANSPIESYDLILLPILETGVYYQKWKERFHAGQKIFGYNFPKETAEQPGIRFVDYMKEDGVAEKNAVAAAEGVLANAITLTKRNLCGSKSLVAGYGRCGSAVAEKLCALKSQVDVLEKDAAKSQEAMKKEYGIVGMEDLSSYDLIVNTIPAFLFDADALKSCREDVVILDIASSPGGVDFTYCKERGIRAELLPGLPAKYAPETSARILAEVIGKYL